MLKPTSGGELEVKSVRGEKENDVVGTWFGMLPVLLGEPSSLPCIFKRQYRQVFVSPRYWQRSEEQGEDAGCKVKQDSHDCSALMDHKVEKPPASH